MSFFDIQNLHQTLHAKDDYSVWEEEYTSRLSSKERVDSGSVSLFHNEDQFDTQLFGMKIGKVETVVGDNTKDISQAASYFFDHMPYDYCLFRIAQQNISWVQEFERRGALLLDTTVDLVCDLSAVNVAHYRKSSNVTKNISARSMPEILDISNSFHFGRFFTDPDLNKGTQMYRSWIENSINGKAADQVYVYQQDDHIHGVITVKHGSHGTLSGVRIPLVGKHPHSKLHHIAQKMLNHVIFEAFQEKKKFLLISTQATNIAALKSYLCVGCVPYSAEITLGWYIHRK